MRATRRAWTVAATALALAVTAVLADRPILLAGTIGIAAWCIARQVQFVRALGRLDAGLTVDQTIEADHVRTDDPVGVSMTATLAEPSSLAVDLETRPPTAFTGTSAADRTTTLAPGDTGAGLTITGSVPVAGRVTFDHPRLTTTDARGLFTETFTRGPTRTLAVAPRTPHDLQLGAGGEQVAVAYGEHDAGRLGAGLDPAELREYHPGDAASRIDWKATARLGELFVREFEAETDRTTVLLVDHRASTDQGRDDQRVIDYLREAALVVLTAAERADDPVGLYTIGDAGLTNRFDPGSGQGHYRTLRDEIQSLAPTERRTPATSPTQPPSTARRLASRLEHDDATFATTLRPFLAATDAYVTRIDADPLFGATRRHLARLRGSVFTVILTDDTNRAELREAVKVARRGDDAVAVFIAPQVLYAESDLATVADAYERYLDFEEFRRDLARLDRVSAFEVAPGERLGALLARRRRERQAPAEPVGEVRP